MEKATRPFPKFLQITWLADNAVGLHRRVDPRGKLMVLEDDRCSEHLMRLANLYLVRLN